VYTSGRGEIILPVREVLLSPLLGTLREKKVVSDPYG